MLDGEIVAFDAEGRPSFQLLQTRMHLRSESAVKRQAQAAPVTYMIFDLLWLDGHSLTGRPTASAALDSRSSDLSGGALARAANRSRARAPRCSRRRASVVWRA